MNVSTKVDRGVQCKISVSASAQERPRVRHHCHRPSFRSDHKLRHHPYKRRDKRWVKQDEQYHYHSYHVHHHHHHYISTGDARTGGNNDSGNNRQLEHDAFYSDEHMNSRSNQHHQQHDTNSRSSDGSAPGGSQKRSLEQHLTEARKAYDERSTEESDILEWLNKTH